MLPEIHHLPFNSAFSKAVFKQIRPHIPRAFWPQTAVRATFHATPDGFALAAKFQDFSPAQAELAAQAVRQGGIELLVMSPAGRPAALMFQALRWRDSCLYALVPLLFAIPLSHLLSGMAMRVAALLFAVDALALLATHLRLVHRRAALAAVHFSAEIPSPGLRMRAAVSRSLEEIG